MTLLTRRRPAPIDPVTLAEHAAAEAAVARQRAAAVTADLDRARGEAALRRELADADRTARRAELAEAEEDVRHRRAAELEAAELERQHRAGRRQDRRERARRLGVRLRPVAPLFAVNGLALVGQVGYGLDHLTPGGAFALRLVVAVLFAGALESIALYVGWHSHVALLAGATASAARLRVASYVVAGVVAGINYSHFAGSLLTPTAASIAYGLVSLLSPWLWGLHSRRELHLSLERAGVIDHTGARFSAERWRAFPWRTRGARRWSIDHGITDPRQAWSGYNSERAARPRRQTVRVPLLHRGPARPPAVAVLEPGQPEPAAPPALTAAPEPADPATVPDVPGRPDPQVTEGAPVSAAALPGTPDDFETRELLERFLHMPGGDQPTDPAAPDVPAETVQPAEPTPAGPAGGRQVDAPQFQSPQVPESSPTPSQAERVRVALVATNGDVSAATRLLSDTGVTVDPKYANRIARNWARTTGGAR